MFCAVGCASNSSAMTISIYDKFGTPDYSSFGSQYSGLVGSFETDTINFTNWEPFGLTSFAAEITGTLYCNQAGWYMTWFDTNSFFKASFEGTRGYFFANAGGNIFNDNVGEAYFHPGYYNFKIDVQTGLPGVNSVDFKWNGFGSWGGDPHSYGGSVALVPEQTMTLGLLLSSLGILFAIKRRGRTNTAGHFEKYIADVNRL